MKGYNPAINEVLQQKKKDIYQLQQILRYICSSKEELIADDLKCGYI